MESLADEVRAMGQGRSIPIWMIAIAFVVAALALVSAVIGMRSGAEQFWNRGPELPTPSATDAAANPLTTSGVRLTIKQRSHAWLPGGKLKLHVDDVTGQQVLVSVTDDSGRVVLAPQSVRKGDRFDVSGMQISVVRLENILIGSAGFGEFEVTLKP